MMFFTDLDRTIIYSKRFIKGIDEPLVVVEMKEGREISYMTKRSISLLEEIRSCTQFIPVTARKWDEIMRIDFIANDVPAVMVCEAGRSIYLNGKRDTSWDEHIHQMMDSRSQNINIAFERFKTEMNKLGYPAWEINEYMWMTKVEGWKEEVRSYVEEMTDWFSEKDCLLQIQERKVYLIPTKISKGAAVRYLLDRYQPEKSLSSGDAEMDRGMFEQTLYQVAPKHHTISCTDSVMVTTATGLYAGEEILSIAKEKLCE